MRNPLVQYLSKTKTVLFVAVNNHLETLIFLGLTRLEGNRRKSLSQIDRCRKPMRLDPKIRLKVLEKYRIQRLNLIVYVHAMQIPAVGLGKH